jgi:nitroreductase
MELLDAIFTRRSIRKFTGDAVSEADLHTILRAACYAPSAHNHQPWHFVVVRSPAVLQTIAAVHPYAKMLPQAGCAIVVCGDKELQTTTGFLVEDCSAAIQNMLLAAHDLGLGAVWCGIYPVPKLTRLVSGAVELPAQVTPVGLVALGQKAEERHTRERFDPAKIHYDKW